MKRAWRRRRTWRRNGSDAVYCTSVHVHEQKESPKETTAPCPDETKPGPLGRQAETGKAASGRGSSVHWWTELGGSLYEHIFSLSTHDLITSIFAKVLHTALPPPPATSHQHTKHNLYYPSTSTYILHGRGVLWSACLGPSRPPFSASRRSDQSALPARQWPRFTLPACLVTMPFDLPCPSNRGGRWNSRTRCNVQCNTGR